MQVCLDIFFHALDVCGFWLFRIFRLCCDPLADSPDMPRPRRPDPTRRAAAGLAGCAGCAFRRPAAATAAATGAWCSAAAWPAATAVAIPDAAATNASPLQQRRQSALRPRGRRRPAGSRAVHAQGFQCASCPLAGLGNRVYLQDPEEDGWLHCVLNVKHDLELLLTTALFCGSGPGTRYCSSCPWRRRRHARCSLPSSTGPPLPAAAAPTSATR